MNNLKTKIKTSYEKLVEKTNNYKRDLKKAYYAGYRDGYKTSASIPNVPGAFRKAKIGYIHGLKGYKKVHQASVNNDRYEFYWSNV